jgi:hypothetical protein
MMREVGVTGDKIHRRGHPVLHPSSHPPPDKVLLTQYTINFTRTRDKRQVFHALVVVPVANVWYLTRGG